MAAVEKLLDMVDQAQEEIVRLTQDLVRARSVNTGVMPTGNECEVCDVIQKKLAGEGVRSQILESAPDRGNLIARLEGKRGSPRLLYMAHADVVPVEDETQWTHPPFSAQVAGGRIWGRGASDCKSLVAAETMALVILKRAGVSLQGDLVLATGADEESGGKYGFGWLVEKHPQLLRADFAINEGGGYPVKTARGLAYLLSVGEKGRLELNITVKGKSFHASQPWMGDNAAFKMAEVIRKLQHYEPERDTSADTFRYLEPLFDITDTPTPHNIDQLIARLARMQPVPASVLRALSRMTLAPTIVQGGVKSNNIPERFRITCDVRTLPHQDAAYVRREVEKVLAGLPDVSLEVDETAIPSASPYETGFADKVKEASAQAVGKADLQWYPVLTVGFTDSRLVRPIVPIVYNFTPAHPEDDPELSGAHRSNESVDIRTIIMKTKMLVALAVLTLA